VIECTYKQVLACAFAGAVLQRWTISGHCGEAPECAAAKAHVHFKHHAVSQSVLHSVSSWLAANWPVLRQARCPGSESGTKPAASSNLAGSASSSATVASHLSVITRALARQYAYCYGTCCCTVMTDGLSSALVFAPRLVHD
jgi:hypothetical protein